MRAQGTHSDMARSKKLDLLYTEGQHWQSDLRFREGETTFITHLFDSYTFEPNTSQSFDLLQGYRKQIMTAQKRKNSIIKKIAKHKACMGGMLQCSDQSYDLSFKAKQNKLKGEFETFKKNFRSLKLKSSNRP